MPRGKHGAGPGAAPNCKLLAVDYAAALTVCGVSRAIGFNRQRLQKFE